MHSEPPRQSRPTPRLTPFTIALLYAVIGVAWILFSDRLLETFVADVGQLTRFAIVKGSFYVLFTSILLYLLIRRKVRSVSESEARYRMLMEQAADGIFISDGNGNHLEVNQKACDLLGYSESELLRLNAREVVDPGEQAGEPLRFDMLRNGKTIMGRRNLRRKDGSLFPADISVKMLADGRILAIIRDVTEAVLREDLILRRNRQLQIVSTAAQRINTVLDIPVIFRSLVASALEMTEAEAGMAGTVADGELVFSEYHTKGKISTVDYRFIPGRGVPGIVMSTKRPGIANDAARDPSVLPGFRDAPEIYNLAAIPILGRNNELLGCIEVHNTAGRRPFDEYDISMLQGLASGAAVAIENTMMLAERNKLESQLRQSQKMEAIGVLAGGIAHDFNNILTAIIGYASMLHLKLPRNDPARSFVDPILISSERAAALVHSLLTFSRKQNCNPHPVDVNTVIRNVADLLARIIGEHIDLRTDLADGELIIMVDPCQMEQVLLNLATNARDAMPGGGSLTIRTLRSSVHEAERQRARPGDFALIQVTDTGAGMDDATRERIFEPFFTTKEVGKGTGLGLAMVYGIISQQNGWVTVTSERGKGSTFTIHLPLCPLSAEGRVSPAPAPLQRGSETVLLAEDSEDVRTLTKTVLADAGYTVIDTADGEDAFRAFLEHRDSIQLAILDVIMPKKNGRECYENIRAVNPAIKVLFSSGYAADVLQMKAILDQGLQFIAKPASPQELLRKVREVLNA
jgi:PAS domain S-box-containing protein